MRSISMALLALSIACQQASAPLSPPPPPPPPPPAAVAAPYPASPVRPPPPPPPRARGRRDFPHSREGTELAARYNGQPAKSRSSGLASYYADSLAGRATASGEPYNPRAFTAAHRSLPFGSIVRVVREDSGQIVYARINDRGPFVRGRVVDLSRAAAESIDMIRRGVVRVRLEVVERGQPTRRSPRKRTGKKRR